METRNIALNLSHVSKEYLLILAQKFADRYSTEKVNGFLMMNIPNVTYQEFMDLTCGYSYWLENGKFHLIFMYPAQSASKTNVILTSKEK